MKKIIVIMLALLMISVPVFAGSIGRNEAIVVTWQKSNGKWKSCGPVQRLSLSENSEDLAIDRVTGPMDYMNTTFRGWHGKYKIYTLGRDLKRGDFDARRCIR